MKQKPVVAIVGAGIGGVTAAAGLRQAGLSPVVYEQAPQLSEVGAGITVTPNASRALAGLGLESQMAAMAEATPHVGALDAHSGERVDYTPRGAAVYLERYGAVTRHIHRADVHTALLQDWNPGADELQTGHALTSATQNENGIELTFANGNTAHCDVLIGADGIKSAVRDALFPTESPQFTGYVAWRGLVPREHAPHIKFDPHFASYATDNKMFGRYPIRHGELINYVAMAKRGTAGEESWTERDDVANVVAEFSGWHKDVTDIISGTPPEGCFRWSLHTRRSLDSWVIGRATLLGDAAHPMTPFLGMGAALAIEDGVVLGRCFAKYAPDWDQALAAYQAARIERGNALHADSLERGKVLFGSNANEEQRSPGFGLDESYMYDAYGVAI